MYLANITKTVTVRAQVPWFNDDIKNAKQQRRKHEHKWRMSGLESDRRVFTLMRNRTTKLMENARRVYYADFISDNNTDQRRLFKAANMLLGRSGNAVYPPHSDSFTLANDFGRFFIKKITDIRTKLDSYDSAASLRDDDEPCVAGPLFTTFEPVTPDYVRKLIVNSPNKSCASDPVPTTIVKDCVDVLLPVVTTMINLSLKDGFFPDKWKEALVKPILKKPNADLEFKNFRPVSNLSFLSKLTEKAVSHQMVHHMTTHDLMPVFQSAYREGHSTETALIKIRNDILMNMNNQEVTLLVLLALSAAFDTIDHTLLIRRLQSRFGFTGTAIAWLRSYLSNRFQYVVIDDTCSNRFDLSFGVPQGSCLGPLLFSIYTSQLFDIVSHHLPQVHCYADDTQLYLAFKPDNNATQLAAVRSMEACVEDLRRRMNKDKLMLNDDKTEFVLIGTKQQLAKVCIDTLSVGISEVSNSSLVRNLGSWFDCNFTMATHVKKIAKQHFLSSLQYC